MVSIEDIKIVEEEYTFPFTPHDYQYETIVESINKGNVLNRAKVGYGKSLMSLYLGLYLSIKAGVEQILITMPPALIDQWEEFILSVKGLSDILVYRGTPIERKAMDVTAYPIVLVSNRIFVKDFKVFEKMGKKRKLFVIGDELSLKSSNQTYKCWKELLYRRQRLIMDQPPYHSFCALNATPVSDRSQVYWWTSVFIPDAYVSQKVFKKIHVLEEDNWGNPLKYCNIDLMDDNFDKMSVLPKDAFFKMPEQVFTKIPYSMERKHKTLYEAVLEAEFSKLDPTIFGAIDAMFSLLQRVVLCPMNYGLDIRSPVFDVIDSLIDQMDDEDKVIIYTRHVEVSRMLVSYFGSRAVSYFGKVSKANKKENLRAFKSGEAEIMIANLDSLSKGQNLQVANQTIFVELPFRSDSMTQACGRTARQGQLKDTCFFYLPVAKGTIQTQICRNLLANDMDLRMFNNNKKTLEEWLKS